AEGDLGFLSQVGRLVALAVEATLSRRELEQANDRLQSERDRLQLLLEVGEAVSSRLDLPGLLRAGSAGLRHLGHPEVTAPWLPDADGRHLRASAVEPAGDDRPAEEPLVPVAGSPWGEAFASGRTVCLGPGEVRRLAPAPAREVTGRGDGAFCAVPLRCG